MTTPAPTSPTPKSKLVPIGILFIVVVVLFWLIIEKRRSSTEGLPKTIEQYRAVLHQPDFGMFFLDFSHALSPSENHPKLGSTKTIGNLIADYSMVARKRISYGRSWLKVTNDISYDDSSTPRTRSETLKLIESILRTNGGFIFPLNDTNSVLLTQEDLKDLGHIIPNSPHP